MMKRNLLMTTMIVLGLSLSGASHALLIMMPNGAKAEAQVVGNRLMLVDVSGKLTPARDGAYKTGSGGLIVVQGGIIAKQGAGTAPIDSKVNSGVAAPLDNKLGAAAGRPVPSGSTAMSPAARPGVPPPVAGGAAAKVVSIGQLSSKAQFKALPNDTLLDVGGRQVRKADFIAEIDRSAAAGTAGAAIRQPGLSAIRARLAADENAAIAASGAEVRRGIAEIRAQGGAP